jgi:hypothetical protein
MSLITNKNDLKNKYNCIKIIILLSKFSLNNLI